MERFLYDGSRVDKGRYYYTYRLTPEFLESRRHMVLWYAGTKLFLGVLHAIFLIKLGFHLCFTLPLESCLFFVGMIMITYGLINVFSSTLKFLLIYCEDPRGQRVKRENYKSSLGYLCEDEDYVYYFKMDVQPDDYYETIRLPQGLSDLQRKVVSELALYKGLKKYVRSIRFLHFKPDRKQKCLAAICEIIEDLVVRNSHLSGEKS